MIHIKTYNQFINEVKTTNDNTNDDNTIYNFVYLDHYNQLKPPSFIKKLINAISKRNYTKTNVMNGKTLHGVTNKELTTLNKFKSGN